MSKLYISTSRYSAAIQFRPVDRYAQRLSSPCNRLRGTKQLDLEARVRLDVSKIVR